MEGREQHYCPKSIANHRKMRNFYFLVLCEYHSLRRKIIRTVLSLVIIDRDLHFRRLWSRVCRIGL